MSTFIIARLTLREAIRRRLVWVAVVLSAAFLVIYALGLNSIEADLQRSPAILQSQAHNLITLAGLYVVNFLLVMMTVLSSVDTLSGEIATGTVHTLLSKPVRRWEIVIGKWLGFVSMLTVYLLVMAGGAMVISQIISGYTPPHVERGLALLWLNTVLLLTVSLLGGTMLSTLANGVLVFGLYGVAFIGGWVEQIGALLQNDAAVNVGIVSSLLLPSEALWRRAAYEMQSALASATGLGGATPFSSLSVPSPAMIVYALLYAAAALALALRAFSRRDL